MAEKYFSPPHIYSFSWPPPPRMTLHRPSWVRLNRLRTGVGLFRSTSTNGDWCPRQNADAEQRSERPITYYVPCITLQMGHLVWRFSMMTMWTG